MYIVLINIFSIFIRKEYYVSKSRLKIAKNIIDINRFSPLKDKNQITKLRRSLNLPLKNKIILYAGYLNERKGLDLLIELGVYLKKKYKNISLVVIGDKHNVKIFGRNNKKNNLLFLQFDKLIDGNNIIHHNYQSNIDEYFYCSDLLFHPSKKEGNPNVVLEAMSAGVACFFHSF